MKKWKYSAGVLLAISLLPAEVLAAGPPPLSAVIPPGGCAHIVLPTQEGGTTRVANQKIWAETGLTPSHRIAAWVSEWKSGGNTLIICPPKGRMSLRGTVPILLAEHAGNERRIVEVPLHWRLMETRRPARTTHVHRVSAHHPESGDHTHVEKRLPISGTSAPIAPIIGVSIKQASKPGARTAAVEHTQVKDLIPLPSPSTKPSPKAKTQISPEATPKPVLYPNIVESTNVNSVTTPAPAKTAASVWVAAVIGALAMAALSAGMLLVWQWKKRRKAEQTPLVLTSENMGEDDPFGVVKADNKPNAVDDETPVEQ